MSTFNRAVCGLHQILHTAAGGAFRTIPATFASRSYVLGQRAQSTRGSGKGMDSSKGIVPLAEVKRFMVDSLVAVGTSAEHACAMADLLVAADHKGHQSHGLNRLDMYLQEVEAGTCDANATPCLIKETAATAWVNGNNGFGAVVGNYCMQLAIKKAKECGVGWVVANNTNHYGIAAWYSLQAVKEGLLGMSFSNTSPLMCPTGAKEAALGTNPLTLAAPGNNCDNFVLDMATTAVAVGKIEIQVRKKEPIPDGWAQGPDGKMTNDAQIAFNTGRLLPLGGTKINSGYKGYGMGMFVDILSGVLAGSNFGPKIAKWKDTSAKSTIRNLGQCFVAVDPNCFAPGFEDRMSWLMDHLRCMEPSNPDEPVLVAGDPERASMKKVDAQGGVHYHENQMKASAEMAKKLGIAPMKTK